MLPSPKVTQQKERIRPSYNSKRGHGATRKILFVATVATKRQGHPIIMRLSSVTAFSKEAKKLDSKTPYHMTGICLRQFTLLSQ